MGMITECIIQDKRRIVKDKIYEPFGITVKMKNGKVENYLYVESAQVITIDDKLYLAIMLILDFVCEDVLVDLLDIESITVKYREIKRGD